MADVRHRSSLDSEHNPTWADGPERTTAMFGRLMIEPIVQIDPGVDLHTAVAALIKVAENVEIVHWIELPASILLFLLVPGDPESGAIYVLDRKNGTWYSVDFEDEQFGGYSVSQLEMLLTDCKLLDLMPGGDRPMTAAIKATGEVVTNYWQLFVNRRAYPVQSMRPHPETRRHYYFRPSKKGTDIPLMLTDETIREHLEGAITIGWGYVRSCGDRWRLSQRPLQSTRRGSTS
jgi:hypothetical protein